MTKYSLAAFAAIAAILGGFFVQYDVEAARAAEKARIEAITSTPEYQAAKAAHFARLARMEAARDAQMDK